MLALQVLLLLIRIATLIASLIGIAHELIFKEDHNPYKDLDIFGDNQ